ncbi:MAG: restriction endonuclease subunit S [Methylobacter sp.]
MKTVEFGSLFQFIRNGMNVKQDKSGDGIPITRIETIANATIDAARVGFAGLTEEDCRGWLMEPGDILFSHINSVDHVGKCAVYRGTPEKLIHGMNLLCLRCDETQLIPEFAKYLIREKEFRGRLLNFTNKAVNQASVSIGNLKAIPVIVPALPEQRRIAAILDQAYALRSTRREALAQLDSLTQSIFIEMFGDRATNLKGFKKLPISETTEISTGSTPSRGVEGYFGGSIPWVKTTEVGGETIWDTEEKLTEVGFKSIRGKLHPVNSIIVAMYGQGQTRGRSSLLKVEAACNQACGVIRPSHDFDSNFMFCQLQLAYDQLRALGRGGNQENLNLQLLGSFEILLPPLALQQTFSTRIQVVSTLKTVHRAALSELDTLFASLQHRAFRGEL